MTYEGFIYNRMNIDRIKTAILNQLINVNSLYSLQLQNHIYGCFILMEDIAQHAVDLSGNKCMYTNNFCFNFCDRFSELGLRYGFIMDSKLILNTYNDEYKNSWIDIFKSVYESRDMNEVDKIEDDIIHIIQNNIDDRHSFFINALDTGKLTQEWIDKVMLLLHTPPDATEASLSPPDTTGATGTSLSSPDTTDDTGTTSAISKAICEKPISYRKCLAKTHHKKYNTHKSLLSKTHRKKH